MPVLFSIRQSKTCLMRQNSTGKKCMKKLLTFIVLIVVLIFAGLAVFVSTYDINKLKPKITEQLSEIVGNPVSIDHLSLHLGAGIRLGIEDFVITENGTPALQVSEVEGSLKLIPLLRKQVQIGTVKLVNPVLHLRKNPDNSIQVQGVNMPESKKSSASPAASQNDASAKTNDAMPVELTIHRIEIRNGSISYQDLSTTGPMRINLSQVDVTLNNVSMDGKVGFEIAAAAFGNAQNIKAKGSLSGLTSDKKTLSQFTAELNLNEINFTEAFRDIPTLQQSGLRDDIRGIAKLSAEKLVVAGSELIELDAAASFENGLIHLTTLENPFTAITAEIQATTDKITIRNFSANLLGGSVALKGSSADYLKNPRSQLELQIKNISVRDALRAAKQSVRLDGQLSLNFSGAAVGKDWSGISQTLSGGGNFVLEKGMILEANPMKEMLNKMSFIPGFQETVNKQIPESLKAKIDSPTTPILKPLAHSFEVRNGVVTLNGFELPTELFTLQSDMSIKLSGHAFGRGVFMFGKDLSNSLTQGAGELSMLADQRGVISIPIRFNAGNEGYSILPEFNNLNINQIVSRGQQLISGLLGSSAAAQTTTAESDTSGTGSVTTTPEEDAVATAKSLLKAFNL